MEVGVPTHKPAARALPLFCHQQQHVMTAPLTHTPVCCAEWGGRILQTLGHACVCRERSAALLLIAAARGVGCMVTKHKADLMLPIGTRWLGCCVLSCLAVLRRAPLLLFWCPPLLSHGLF